MLQRSDEARQLGVSKEARRRIADIRFDYLDSVVSRQIGWFITYTKLCR